MPKSRIIKILLFLAVDLWPAAKERLNKYLKVRALLFWLMLAPSAYFWLCGCGSWQQKTIKPPLYSAKADIQIAVGDKVFDGMGVTKFGPVALALYSKAKINLLRITSCSRTFVKEQGDPGWFVDQKKIFQTTYEYIPGVVETEGVCPLYIEAHDRSGVTAWGYLTFRTDETLPSKVECNGVSWTFAGHSVCQAKTGTEQLINFDRPVKYAETELCQVRRVSDRSFRLRGAPGFCYVTFSSEDRQKHRMTFLNFEEVLVRGE